MNKPQDYDATQAFTGEYETLSSGGHVCIIKQAKIDKTQKTDKDILIIMFDIYEGENKDYYKRDYERRKETNAEAKWQGTYRQLTDGKSLPFFKGMITAIENSNPGYKWNWDEATLKGKLFGGLFGQEEYQGNDGKVKMSTKCRFIRSAEQVKKGLEVPEIKRLSGSTSAQNEHSTGFNVDSEESDLPF